MPISPSAPPSPGIPFGKYVLLGKLAAGGMGELFLAELVGAGNFRKLVVLKRLLPHLAEDPEFESLFFNEARIAAMVSHSNICHVYELGRADDEYFIAMEYLEGVTFLDAFKAAWGQLHVTWWSPELVVSLFCQICEGLHHVHELSGPDGNHLGVVHRDVSPTNLFITTAGIAKVLDFGVAKIRAQAADPDRSSLKGKFAYMSPEQLRSDPLDRRSDLFSLGVVLFEALAGVRVFNQKSDALIAQAIMDGHIRRLRDVRPDIDPSLDDVLACVLSPDPAERFPDAHAFSEALLDSIGGRLLPPSRIARSLQPVLEPYVTQRRQTAKAVISTRASNATLAFERATRSLAAPIQDAPAFGLEEASDWFELSSVSGQRPAEPLSPHEETPAVVMRKPARKRRLWAVLLAIPAAALAGVIAVWLISPWLLGAKADGDPEPSGAGEETPAAADERPSRSPVDAPAPPDGGAVAVAVVTSPTDAGRRSGSVRPRPDRQRRDRDRPDASPPEGADVIAEEPGHISFASTPYASVYVDGKRVGDTPVYRLELEPGQHEVRAVLAGGQSQSVTVRVRSGDVTTHRFHW